jgi:ABC-type branched-subunit amino acid transport system ATPase component
MAEALLTLENILVRHGGATVLDIPQLELRPGETLALIGPNGAGKSTLLRVMGLLQPPSAGIIRFHGERANGENSLSRAAAHQRFGLRQRRVRAQNPPLGSS